MRFPNAARCQGACEPSGTFKASVSFLKGEAEGEEVGGGGEFLLKGLKDSILGHRITAFHARSDSKVQNFGHAQKAWRMTWMTIGSGSKKTKS